MARDPSLLTSKTPTAIVPAEVQIAHVQLRDLIICPRERGVVNYVYQQSIMERNLNTPDLPARPLAKLSFLPNTLASLPIPGTDDTLLAAGGQDTEIHLSYHSPLSRHRHGALWQTEHSTGGSINNSVLLTSMSLTRSNESSVEPRIGISNNDSTFKFYNVPIRGPMKRSMEEVGSLRLSVPVNHSSISPDGRTLLSVGDSAKVHLHQMTGGARITFSPIATLKLPSPSTMLFNYGPSSLMASFSSAFSADGLKFSVASQEGLLAVWDVRSTKPLKVFETEKSRTPGGNGGASGWIGDELIYDMTGGSFKAPGWSVRNVKFGGSGDKEIMTFTEHTSSFHIVDARTFETEEIIQVPSARDRQQQTSSTNLRTQHDSGNPRSLTAPRSHYVRVNSPRNLLTIPRQNGYSSRSQSQIVQALGDTFRPYSPPSSISDSTWRALRMSDPARTSPVYGYNDILIIPPLGDSNIQSDVQALLGSHPIRRQRQQLPPHIEAEADSDNDEDNDHNTGSTYADYEYTPRQTYVGSGNRRRYDEEMEVDELESDCVSSHTPSRSSSPSPSTHVPTATSPGSIGRIPTPVSNMSNDDRRTRNVCEKQVAYDMGLDIAGTCFDPQGRYIYVASTESIAEWKIRGTDKRWWAGSEWM